MDMFEVFNWKNIIFNQQQTISSWYLLPPCVLQENSVMSTSFLEYLNLFFKNIISVADWGWFYQIFHLLCLYVISQLKSLWK